MGDNLPAAVLTIRTGYGFASGKVPITRFAGASEGSGELDTVKPMWYN